MTFDLFPTKEDHHTKWQKIYACVVDGLHADLVKTGAPLSISLLRLSMDSTQWTAKLSHLVDFLYPSSGLGSAYNIMGPLRVAGMLAIGRSEIGED